MDNIAVVDTSVFSVPRFKCPNTWYNCFWSNLSAIWNCVPAPAIPELAEIVSTRPRGVLLPRKYKTEHDSNSNLALSFAWKEDSQGPIALEQRVQENHPEGSWSKWFEYLLGNRENECMEDHCEPLVSMCGPFHLLLKSRRDEDYQDTCISWQSSCSL